MLLYLLSTSGQFSYFKQSRWDYYTQVISVLWYFKDKDQTFDKKKILSKQFYIYELGIRSLEILSLQKLNEWLKNEIEWLPSKFWYALCLKWLIHPLRLI